MKGKTHSWLGFGPSTVLHVISVENSLSRNGTSFETVELLGSISSSTFWELVVMDSVRMEEDKSSSNEDETFVLVILSFDFSEALEVGDDEAVAIVGDGVDVVTIAMDH